MTDQAAMILADDGDGDLSYFRHRAEWHVRRAEIAGDSATRTLHERFAKMYALRSESQPST